MFRVSLLSSPKKNENCVKKIVCTWFSKHVPLSIKTLTLIAFCLSNLFQMEERFDVRQIQKFQTLSKKITSPAIGDSVKCFFGILLASFNQNPPRHVLTKIANRTLSCGKYLCVKFSQITNLEVIGNQVKMHIQSQFLGKNFLKLDFRNEHTRDEFLESLNYKHAR